MSWPWLLAIDGAPATYEYFILCGFPKNVDRWLPHTDTKMPFDAYHVGKEIENIGFLKLHVMFEEI